MILVTFISGGFSNIDFVFAQGNSLGQDGEGDNESFQSESSSQESNQNNMCVSGENTSLSCNNLSSENNDRQTREDEQKPLSIQGKIYQKSNSDTEDEDNYIATVSCEEGDTAIY